MEGGDGTVVFRDYLEQASEAMTGAPVEGDEAAFPGSDGGLGAGSTGRADGGPGGRYKIMNTIVGMFLSTRVCPAKAGRMRFLFRQHLHNSILVAVNGEVQVEAWGRGEVDVSAGAFEALYGEQSFELEVDAERRRKCADHCRAPACADVQRQHPDGNLFSGELKVRPPLKDLPKGADRKAVEEALMDISVLRETFYPDDRIRVAFAGSTRLKGELHCELIRGGRVRQRGKRSLTKGQVALGTGKQTGDGPCELRVSIRSGPRTVLGECRFEGLVLTPTPDLPGHENYGKRKRLALRHHAAGNDIWAQVARYALGREDEIDGDSVWETCRQIRAREDCADFVIQALLRLMFMDRDRERIDPHIRAMIKDTCVGFKYWVDEPGDDVMVTGTENHRMLFHVAEFLAGTLWPLEVFPNSDMNGLQHAAKARQYIMEWLNQRGRFGFDEWHSNSYYPITLAPLNNVLDWTHPSENRLKMQARLVLTMGCYNMAADSLGGVFGSTHGRTYVQYVKNPDHDGTAGMQWVLFGVGSLHSDPMGTVSLATSSYEPPEVLSRIAEDRENVALSLERQGFAAEGSANFIVYRTPDYMMSALQDYNPGRLARQTHPFQMTFRDKVVLFFSSPKTAGEGGGLRPDYWSGNGSLPRVFGNKNVALLLFRNEDLTWMSHVFFERDRFDEVAEKGGWIFVRKGDGYAAIWSEHGYEVGRIGQYAGRELICRADENAWIVEAGRKADWKSFKAFVAKLSAITPRRTKGQIVYPSPSVGTVRMGWTGPITVRGRKAQLRGYPLVEGPFAQAAFGSGEMVIRHGELEEELWFNQS